MTESKEEAAMNASRWNSMRLPPPPPLEHSPSIVDMLICYDLVCVCVQSECSRCTAMLLRMEGAWQIHICGGGEEREKDRLLHIGKTYFHMHEIGDISLCSWPLRTQKVKRKDHFAVAANCMRFGLSTGPSIVSFPTAAIVFLPRTRRWGEPHIKQWMNITAVCQAGSFRVIHSGWEHIGKKPTGSGTNTHTTTQPNTHNMHGCTDAHRMKSNRND